MPIQRSDLPPFAALLAFEAVERLGSFTAAAKELRVSQAAVSQKVGELEVWLNATLVRRTRPRIGFTDDGMAVGRSVRNGIASLTSTLEPMRQRHDRAQRVTLAATNSFALYWLGPRLQDFYASHPEIELNLLTSDATVRQERQDFDIAIVLSPAQFPGFESQVMMPESVIAVAGPNYLVNRPPGLTAGAWEQETLLSQETDDETWLDWEDWFRRTGSTANSSGRVERFSSYVTLLQAAVAGRGIAMGWRQLVTPLIAQGQLVQIDKQILSSREQYRIVFPRHGGGQNHVAMAALLRWLQEMASACSSENA